MKNNSELKLLIAKASNYYEKVQVSTIVKKEKSEIK